MTKDLRSLDSRKLSKDMKWHFSENTEGEGRLARLESNESPKQNETKINGRKFHGS